MRLLCIANPVAYQGSVTDIPLSYPPNAELGDLATPVCLALAKQARKPPRQIAEAIRDAIETGSGIARVEVAGPGYLNAFFDRDAFLRAWLTDPRESPAPSGPKRIVEHTNINPNKAAHIGHLRNAVLGDTLVRFLKRLGREVETQNYIDDTGVQVADLVVGFLHVRGESLQDVLRLYSDEALARRGERFDYVAWDLYAEVTRWFDTGVGASGSRFPRFHAPVLEPKPEQQPVGTDVILEFRGADILQQEESVRRCWNHVPLAPPLWVSPASEVGTQLPHTNGLPFSIHTYNLDPGNNLAPLINGNLSLSEGVGLMEFELKNGTRESVDVTLDFEQPDARLEKTWRRTAFLVNADITSLDRSCLVSQS